MSKRKQADTQAPESEDTQAPEHAGTPEEAAMLQTLEKEAGVNEDDGNQTGETEVDPVVAADTSAPVVAEVSETNTGEENRAAIEVALKQSDRIGFPPGNFNVSGLNVPGHVLTEDGLHPAESPVPSHLGAEARERAAALDAEYSTARREVAETGYKRTVHCRSCGNVVSLGEACPLDSLIAV